MYTTKAIAKKVQNGNFEVIEIERLQDISTRDFSTLSFNRRLFQHQNFHSWILELWSFQLLPFEPWFFQSWNFLPSGEEKSGVEARGWEVWGWNILQPFNFDNFKISILNFFRYSFCCVHDLSLIQIKLSTDFMKPQN